MSRGKACSKCKTVVPEGDVCPKCGSTDLTSEWDGEVYVIDPDSDLAEMAGIEEEGEYALKV